MRLTGSRVYSRPVAVPKMPPGLVDLMESLAKDVLRHNPPDVYEFCANHMEKLLEIREGRAPKQPLTLEQKIARAQEKVKKNAEERRQKYDREMIQRINQDNNQVVSQEIEDEIIEETALKVPVHHDKELADALEMEIYRKPSQVQNTINDSKESALKLTEETLNKSNEEQDETKEYKVNIADLEIEVISHDLQENDDIRNNEDLTTENIPGSMNNLQENLPGDDLKEEGEMMLTSTELLEDKLMSSETEGIIQIQGTAIDDPAFENEAMHYNLKENETVVNNSPLHGEVTIHNSEENHNLPENQEVSLSESESNTSEIAERSVIDTTNNTVEHIRKPRSIEDSEQDSEQLVNTLQENDTIIKDTEVNSVRAAQISNIITGESEAHPGKSPEITIDEKVDESYISEGNLDILINVDGAPKEIEYTVDGDTDGTQNSSVKIESNEISEVKFVHDIISTEVNDFGDNFDNVSSKSNNGVIENMEEPGITLQTYEDNDIGKNDNITVELPALQNKISSKSAEKEVNNADAIETNHDNDAPGNAHETISVSSEDSAKLNEMRIDFKENSVLDFLDSNDRTIIPKDNLNIVVSEKDVDNAENGKEIHGTIVMDSAEPVVDTEATNDQEISMSHETGETGQNHEDITTVIGHDGETQVAKDLIRESNDEDVSNPSEISNKVTDAEEKVFVSEPIEIIEERESVSTIDNNLQENTTAENDDKTSVGSLETKSENSDSEIAANEILDQEMVKRDLASSTEVSEKKSLTGTVQTGTETLSLIKSSSINDSTIGDNDSILELYVTKNVDEPVENSAINHSSMDLETAAITIQKVFRTFLFKSRNSTFDDAGNDENISTDDDNEKVEIDFPTTATSQTKERRTLGISRMDTVLQTVNEEKSLSLSTDDSSTISSAATIIQAHVRGFLVRNRLNSNKTASSTSLVNSDGPSTTSLEADNDQHKNNKTVLNIHIVPENDHFLSRDESILTSMDLSFDESPHSSTKLHPLGYDKSEPRKQLKREDAIQSVSPPSNNSGKLSEDVESVKEVSINDAAPEQQTIVDSSFMNEPIQDADIDSGGTTPSKSTLVTVIEAHKNTSEVRNIPEPENEDSETVARQRGSLTKMSSDESDVVTPFDEDRLSIADSDNTSKLLHSGEFHDMVLPTKVSRSDTSVVREFKSVVVYFLLWNNS